MLNYRTLFSLRSTRLTHLNPLAEAEPAASLQADPASTTEVVPATTGPMGTTARTLIGVWVMTLFAVALGHVPWAWSLAEQVAAAKRPVHAHWFGLECGPHSGSAPSRKTLPTTTRKRGPTQSRHQPLLR